MFYFITESHVLIYRDIHYRSRISYQRAYVHLCYFVAGRGGKIIGVLYVAVTYKHIFKSVIGETGGYIFSVTNTGSAAGQQ